MANGSESSRPTISLATTLAGIDRPVPPLSAERKAWTALVALLAAILVHVLFIAPFVMPWPEDGMAIEPPAITVELVPDEPPPQAEPEPQDEPAASPQPPAQQRLESGGETDRSPGGEPERADASEPAAEPDSAQEPVEESPLGEVPPPARKPVPRSAQPVPASPPAQTVARAPTRGAGEGGGDPYLNLLRDRIVRNRDYPAVAGPLHLSGTAQYEIMLDRGGGIVRIRLLRSSGAGTLDEAGAATIRRAAPFPPVPAYIQGNPVRLVLQLYLGPSQGNRDGQ